MTIQLDRLEQLKGCEILLKVSIHTTLGLTSKYALGTALDAIRNCVHLKNLRFLDVPALYTYSTYSDGNYRFRPTPMVGSPPQPRKRGFGLSNNSRYAGAVTIPWKFASLEAINGVKLTVLYGTNITTWPYVPLYAHFTRRMYQMVEGDRGMVDMVFGGSRNREGIIRALRLCRDAQVKSIYPEHNKYLRGLFSV